MTASVGVGLIGLGTVGSAVARRLITDWALLGGRAGATPILRRVAVREPRRTRDVDLRNARLDDDPETLVDDPGVELVVELMGGVDRASSLIERALAAGKPVVTANKAAMAAHGIELAQLAAERSVSLRYEAAVGGAIPVVALLRDSLRGDRVSSIEAIINGTTNVILSRMESDGLDFAAALLEAQTRGFAEADPSADVEGHDSAAKLVLLSRLAFDLPLMPSDVDRQGIGAVHANDIICADSMDGSVKLVALAQMVGEAVTLSVRPTVVVAGHPLYGVDGAENAVVVTSDLAGTLAIRGAGAGGDATASAVISDIVATIGESRTGAAMSGGDDGGTSPAGAPALHPQAGPAAAVAERGAYLRVRLTAVDQADRLVTLALEDRGIAVVAATVLSGPDGRPAEIAVLTRPLPRAMVVSATDTLESLTAVAAVAAVMDCAGAE